MKRIFVFLLLLAGSFSARAQAISQIIRQQEVTRIEQALSSDEMEGREVGKPGIKKAAAFIAAEMKQAGLQPLPGKKDFLQPFHMLEGKTTRATATINGVAAGMEQICCISSAPILDISEKSGYKVIQVKAGENLIQAFRPYAGARENILILADQSLAAAFKSLQRFAEKPRFPQNNQVVVVLTSETNASTYSIRVEQQVTAIELANVAGMLRGKRKPEEYVVFSGHYDHLGYGKPDSKGDSLYNGANDDASGVTAVLMLARYFSQLRNNERTLIFTAFTAEEVGGWGSTYFSRQFDPASVAAMFNIEMIGTESKWGTGSAYLTGYEKTDMGKILEKNLKGSPFRFYPDPYPKQQLFYRSDNATLARQGVPAHTLSTSKMDNEPHYHKASDAIETLNMKNMTEVIKAIAVSARTIVAGVDTPTRVDTTQLKKQSTPMMNR